MIKKISELKRISALERMAASLSRIWEHATQNEYGCAMISASRGIYSKLQNLKRTYDLSRDLKAEGFSWISTHGAYVEGIGSGKEQEVLEDSFFVIGNTKDFEQFVREISELGEKFQQDSVLIIRPDHTTYILGTQDFNEKNEKVEPGKGNVWEVGTFHPTQIGKFYSKWKQKKFEFRSTASVDSMRGKQLALVLHALEQEKKGV